MPGAFHTAHAEGRGLYEFLFLLCLWGPWLDGVGQGSAHSLRGGSAAARRTHPKVIGFAPLARANAFCLLHVPAQLPAATLLEPIGCFGTHAVHIIEANALVLAIWLVKMGR